MDLNYFAAKPKECDIMTWLGMPMVYDWGLCVNRTPEEVEESKLHHQGF